MNLVVEPDRAAPAAVPDTPQPADGTRLPASRLADPENEVGRRSLSTDAPSREESRSFTNKGTYRG